MAFRMSELNNLPPKNWEDCFAEVIFPLLTKLLTNISPMDPIGMEEIRVRVIQLISKIFLYHLRWVFYIFYILLNFQNEPFGYFLLAVLKEFIILKFWFL